jgi:hypothetical protein
VIDATKREVFSIGIYRGKSPFALRPAPDVVNPVLTREDVTDVPADQVADPFLVREADQWHMFFEVVNASTKRGQIAVASSTDCRRWQYQGIVLDEPFHLSYPNVIMWEGGHYMIPESCEANSVRLYKAIRYPFEWEFVGNLLEGRPLVDATPVFHDGKWWLFAASGTAEQWRSAELFLYYADRLTGPWTEHPMSPVIRNDRRIARPAGRIRLVDGKLIRFTQDCHLVYGMLVRGFEITRLTTTDYQERPARRGPVLKPTRSGWNAVGMHHIDSHPLDDGTWIACVDGWHLEDKPA